MERRWIYRVVDDEYWRHGVADSRRRMCLDGRAQEEEAVWRHGGADGRQAWQGRYIIVALRMDRGMMEVTENYFIFSTQE